MSYDHGRIAAKVKAKLEVDPNTTLVSMCRTLGIDRHTVDRALAGHFGMTFRELKNQVRDEKIKAALSHDEVRSVKQAAHEAGYGSAASLARRTRRAVGMTPATVRTRHRRP